MQTPIPYMGNKSQYCNALSEFIPKKINAYIEVFAGSAALLFARSEWAKTEVINDTSGDVVNFFKVLREQGDELKRLVTFTPYSREEFYRCHKIVKKGAGDDLTRAWAFYVIQSQSVMACGVSWAGTAISDSDEVQRRINRENVLLLAAERLKKTIIDNQDYSYILEKYENKNNFFFIDPPYLSLKDEKMTSRAYRGHAFTAEKHKELLEKIIKMEGYIIISGYENELYNQYLGGWYKLKIKKSVKVPSGGHQAEEIFWINPAIMEYKKERDKKIKQLRLEL